MTTSKVHTLAKGKTFTTSFWNQQDLPRTKNDLEGWHNRFSASSQERHSHIWKFVEDHQADSSLNHHTVAQLLAGSPNPPQRRVYHDITERSLRLVHGYNNNNIIDFLKRCFVKLSITTDYRIRRGFLLQKKMSKNFVCNSCVSLLNKIFDIWRN